jgi:hypothetical protein
MDSDKETISGSTPRELPIEVYFRACISLRPRHQKSSNQGLMHDEIPAPEDDPAGQIQPKVFKLKWLRVGTEQERQIMQDHINGWLKEHRLAPPPDYTTLEIDPRFCDNPMQWRDTLRDQLNMDNLRLDLKVIYLTDENGGNRRCIYGRDKILNWDATKEVFMSEDVQVHVKLYVLGDGQKADREWQGLPPILGKYVKKGEDNLITPVSRTVPAMGTATQAWMMNCDILPSIQGRNFSRIPGNGPLRWTTIPSHNSELRLLTGDPIRLRIKIVLLYCNPTNLTSKLNPSVYKELQSIHDRPRYLGSPNMISQHLIPIYLSASLLPSSVTMNPPSFGPG